MVVYWKARIQQIPVLQQLCVLLHLHIIYVHAYSIVSLSKHPPDDVKNKHIKIDPNV